MTIPALLFDIGNTLLEYSLEGKWREFRLQRLEEMYPVVNDLVGPVAVPPAEFAAKVGEVIGGERARGIEGSGRSWHFGDRLREGLESVGLGADDDALEQLTDGFYEAIRDCTRPYPDTEQALDCMRSQNIRLAIITNSPWDTPGRLLRGDLERWGIEDFFDAFVCSGDIEWRKPNPAFMLAAAEALGVPPGQCLVVGDKLEADIAGAIAAGMRSMWINRQGSELAPDGPQPHWTGGTLVELIQIVAQSAAPGA